MTLYQFENGNEPEDVVSGGPIVVLEKVCAVNEWGPMPKESGMGSGWCSFSIDLEGCEAMTIMYSNEAKCMAGYKDFVSHLCRMISNIPEDWDE